MASSADLYQTPAKRLDTFVAQELQPDAKWKEEVKDAFERIQKFLKDHCFYNHVLLDQEIKVLKVVKGGSSGKGTTIKHESDVDLVFFLSSFSSFQEQAELRSSIISHIKERLNRCQESLAFDITVGLEQHGILNPRSLSFYIQAKRRSELVRVDVLPAFDALGHLLPNEKPPPQVYENLIRSHSEGGEFSPSFTELQKNFVKHRSAKLKSFLQLVKHWYLEKVKADCPRSSLPPKYALELLAIYAWEVGTQEAENFSTEVGFVTLMKLLRNYQNICIYWTKNYNFQNAIVRDFVKKQLMKTRPIILDPADPTNNVGEGRRWDIVAQKASRCLKQDCCYDDDGEEIESWAVQGAKNVQVIIKQSTWEDYTLVVNPFEPSWKIKEIIRQKRKFTGQLRLSFRKPNGERQLLRGKDTLAQYGIFYRIALYLLETFSPEIQVFVKGPNNQNKVYAVNPNNLIQDLKEKIEESMRLPMEYQLLEFNGEILNDYRPLRYYGIQDSDTIILSKF